MKIPCLFDANAFIKCYFTLRGYEVVRYIVRKSPSAEIFLPNVQGSEIISLLYKAYREGAIASKKSLETYVDTFLKDFKDINKEFFSEHLLSFDIYERITDTPPPATKHHCHVEERIKHAQKCNIGKSLIKKDPCNAGDTILLAIMQDIKNSLDEENNTCFLITSDRHVKTVAERLNFKIIDPLKERIGSLPKILKKDAVIKRAHVRLCVKNLGAICHDITDNQRCLGSSTVLDISPCGVRIHSSKGLINGKRISLNISSHRPRKIITKLSGEVAWSDKKNTGIKFEKPVSANLFSDIRKQISQSN